MGGLINGLVSPRNLDHCRSVLDVGCGIRPQRLVGDVERYLGVDAHQPYVDAMADPTHGPGWSYLCSLWNPALAKFADQEFDLLTALDFIEHLERDDGLEFIAEAQRVAKLVVIFTPLGDFPQPFSEPDQWGMDGGHWQTHRSAWTPDDFKGWEIYIWDSCHTVDGHLNPLPEPIGAFWALKETS